MKRAFLLTITMLFFPALLFAADKAELEKRMKDRYPQLLELKKAGTIGETFEGYVDVREGKDKKVSKLVDDENADRKAVYELIAEETSKSEGKKVTTDQVAKRNAKRTFEKAKPGEYLKGEDGKW